MSKSSEQKFTFTRSQLKGMLEETANHVLKEAHRNGWAKRLVASYDGETFTVYQEVVPGPEELNND